MYRWVYGLKEKNDANAAARKWICYTVGLRARHVLQILSRDNMLETWKVQTLRPTLNYWECRIIFRWSMSSIRTDRLNHQAFHCTQMVKSGLAVTGLYILVSSTVSAKDARNVMYDYLIKQLRIILCTEGRRTCPSYGHDAGTSMFLYWRRQRSYW